MTITMKQILVVLFLAAFSVSGFANDKLNENNEFPVNNIIVKYNAPTTALLKSLQSNNKRQFNNELTSRLAQYEKSAAVKMAYNRAMSGDAHVLRLATSVSEKEAEEIARQIAEYGDVEFAEPDYLASADFTPNDPQYRSIQASYLGSNGVQMRMPGAWDKSRGNDVVVAVIDSGYRPHYELRGKILPGYDFVSGYATCRIEGIEVLRSNDGDKRDPDASDPGSATSSPDYSCEFESRWHGTKVAGIIAADINNGSGIAGIAPGAKILPVRVLGLKGLGQHSDIVDGMRWAAGLSVPGVPNNPNPADILNLSLGGVTNNANCDSRVYRQVMQDLQHVVVIASAGNRGTNPNAPANPADYYVPASCPGVISVAATDLNGRKANFSSYGTTVDIAAFGDRVYSTSNNGMTSPTTDSFEYDGGTSFSAPMIAGVAALILQVRPYLSPAEVEQIIKQSAHRFPFGCQGCGAGIANAQAAVNAALQLPNFPVGALPPIFMLLLEE